MTMDFNQKPIQLSKLASIWQWNVHKSSTEIIITGTKNFQNPPTGSGQSAGGIPQSDHVSRFDNTMLKCNTFALTFTRRHCY